MDRRAKIFIAGGTGLVGSAIIRRLSDKGFTNLVSNYHSRPPITHHQSSIIHPTSSILHHPLDLTRQADVEAFFEKEKPEYVFLAAAKVGGIRANSTYTAEFIYQNLMIAANVIHASYKYGVKKLLNLGSSCIYPRNAPQPMKEEYLLTGELEPTNEPYAVAKIAAIKLCRYYNHQYGTDFISVMPTNLYGPGDNFDLENSHVLPALIRKMHLAKLLEKGSFDLIKKDFLTFGNTRISADGDELYLTERSDPPTVLKFLKFFGITPSSGTTNVAQGGAGRTPVILTLWGTGTPHREFLYVDDLAEAVIFLMEKNDARFEGEFINIGTGMDLPIARLADLVRDVVGFKGKAEYDASMPDGMMKKRLDIARLSLLGWRSSTELKDGIELTYRWYLDMTECV